MVDLRLHEMPLLHGEVDAALGFDGSSYCNLVKLGAKPQTVACDFVAAVGMPLSGNSQAISNKMTGTAPDINLGFVASSAQDWLGAIQDPTAAIATVEAKDHLVEGTLETDKLDWIIKNQIHLAESEAHGMGSVDPARIAQSIQIVKDGFGLHVAPAASAVFDDSFMPSFDHRILLA